MDESKSDDGSGKVTTDSGAALPRRRFLGSVAKATGGLLLADLAASSARAQTSGSAAPLSRSSEPSASRAAATSSSRCRRTRPSTP